MNPAMESRKAEFWLCLARAFLAPVSPQSQAALHECLAEDLEEIVRELDYPVAEDLAALRSALAFWPERDALLSLYSRLFLVPGRAHPPINMGVYFDGTVHGDTVRRVAECYRACGLEKNAAFADLPDHAAVQIEFTAWLFAAQAEGEPPALRAGEFIDAFVVRWAPLLRRDLAQASALCPPERNPWLALAGILDKAATREAALFRANHHEATPAALEEAEIKRLRREYAGRMPGAEELATLREKLLADGLSAQHLGRTSAERDAADGLRTLTPPEPLRHSLSMG